MNRLVTRYRSATKVDLFLSIAHNRIAGDSWRMTPPFRRTIGQAKLSVVTENGEFLSEYQVNIIQRGVALLFGIKI